jgi:membrane-associated phospholipid phosphatase
MKNSSRIIFLTLLFLLLELGLIFYIDQPLADTMRSMDAYHPAWINACRAFTDLGKSKWYLWPTGMGVVICALFIRYASLKDSMRVRQLGGKLLFAFVAIAASGIVTDIIKPIIGRARPVMLLHEDVYGFQPFTFHAQWNSMPSGHATTAMALAFVLSLFFPRGRLVWIALGVVLCLSRVAVNAHFLSDIIAGGMVGYLTVGYLRRFWNMGRFTWNGNKYGMFHVERWLFPIDSSGPNR